MRSRMSRSKNSASSCITPSSASSPGAKEAAERYRNDPDTDFHALVGEMTGLDRDMAKAVNFAKIYGAGVEKFAEMIGKPLPRRKPSTRSTTSACRSCASCRATCKTMRVRLGYTVLYDGARRHWDLWEARWRPWTKGAGPCSHEEAGAASTDPKHPWFYRRATAQPTPTPPSTRRSKATAARHTKLWMRACWREGIVPLLQMHDGSNCSVTTREQGELVARLGCEAVQLEVPMRVDLKFGRSWGDAKACVGGAHMMIELTKLIKHGGPLTKKISLIPTARW